MNGLYFIYMETRKLTVWSLCYRNIGRWLGKFRDVVPSSNYHLGLYKQNPNIALFQKFAVKNAVKPKRLERETPFLDAFLSIMTAWVITRANIFIKTNSGCYFIPSIWMDCNFKIFGLKGFYIKFEAGSRREKVLEIEAATGGVL